MNASSAEVYEAEHMCQWQSHLPHVDHTAVEITESLSAQVTNEVQRYTQQIEMWLVRGLFHTWLQVEAAESAAAT